MSSLEMGECHMSDLEKQLAELPLMPASPELEARVLAELRASSASSCSGGSDSRSQQSSCAPVMNGAIVRGSANSGFAASPWLACAVCLLVGTVSGRLFLPASLRTPLTDSGSVSNSVTDTESSAGASEGSLRTNDSAFSPATGPEQSGWTLDSAMKTGSKIVESSWFSPSVGAVAWEQQTGEIFRVGTHQTDRRFAMCRECHRVGG